MILVSYATAAPPADQIQGLTYGTETAAQRAQTRASWNAVDVVASLVVLAAILAAYLYFVG